MLDIPASWSMASMIQRRGTKTMPPLPKLSIPAAGAMVSTIASHLSPEQLELFASFGNNVKLKDTSDDKTVAEIISPPIPGTSLVLAMTRLDRVGITEGPGWKRTHKVIFSN